MNDRSDGFIHEAFVYRDADAFAAQAAGVAAEAAARDEPVLFAVDDTRAALLSDALAVGRGEFADPVALGSNPARVIDLWDDHLRRHHDTARRVWVISDQRWPVHSAAHLAEHRYDEALVAHELALAPVSLLCCYDEAGLAPSLLDVARDVHPRLRLPGGQSEPNPRYRFVDPAGLLGDVLQPAPPDAATLAVGASQVPTRRFVTDHATTAGLDQHRIADAVLAVDELATNTAMHGGGHGILRAWTDGEWLVYEITDHGRVTDPLAGRRRPSPDQVGGRGLWMVNQLSDLFQLRSHDATTTTRVHFRRSSTRDEPTATVQSR